MGMGTGGQQPLTEVSSIDLAYLISQLCLPLERLIKVIFMSAKLEIVQMLQSGQNGNIFPVSLGSLG